MISYKYVLTDFKCSVMHFKVKQKKLCSLYHNKNIYIEIISQWLLCWFWSFQTSIFNLFSDMTNANNLTSDFWMSNTLLFNSLNIVNISNSYKYAQYLNIESLASDLKTPHVKYKGNKYNIKWCSNLPSI